MAVKPEEREIELLKDEEIIERIVKGNQPDLYQILYRRYFQKVLDKSYSLLKNRTLAMEFAEDILSRAYENLPGFKRASSFSSWLYSITYHYCIDYLRKKKRLHYPEWNSRQEIPEIVDEGEEDYSLVNYEKLMKVLDRIHTEEKALLLMKYQDNLSIRDISRALEVTESAAKMRIKRARARVLYLYKKTYGTAPAGKD